MVLNKYLCFSYLIFSWIIAFTFACNLTLLNEHLIERYLAFHCNYRKKWAGWKQPSRNWFSITLSGRTQQYAGCLREGMIFWKRCLTNRTKLEYTTWQIDGLNLPDRHPLQVHRSPTCHSLDLVFGSASWFPRQGALVLVLPWKTNPKRDVQFFSHLNVNFKEFFLTSCFCLHFLPCCYFITPTRLYMKCLRDGSEVTKQTNDLHIQSHPACCSTARLGEGFKSTERVIRFYLHTLPFWEWGRTTHIYSGSPALWYKALQAWTEQELVNFQDHPKGGVYEID